MLDLHISGEKKKKKKKKKNNNNRRSHFINKTSAFETDQWPAGLISDRFLFVWMRRWIMKD